MSDGKIKEFSGLDGWNQKDPWVLRPTSWEGMGAKTFKTAMKKIKKHQEKNKQTFGEVESINYNDLIEKLERKIADDEMKLKQAKSEME